MILCWYVYGCTCESCVCVCVFVWERESEERKKTSLALITNVLNTTKENFPLRLTCHTLHLSVLSGDGGGGYLSCKRRDILCCPIRCLLKQLLSYMFVAWQREEERKMRLSANDFFRRRTIAMCTYTYTSDNSYVYIHVHVTSCVIRWKCKNISVHPSASQLETPAHTCVCVCVCVWVCVCRGRDG